MLTIEKIMYKPPATIVFWSDDTKTVAVCEKGDTYNRELGFALCVLKKKYGNKTVHDMLDKYVHGDSKYSKDGGGMVWENKKKKEKPKKSNGARKRVRVHSKPDRYLELTIEPVENEPIYDVKSTYDLFGDFFDVLYKL